MDTTFEATIKITLKTKNHNAHTEFKRQTMQNAQTEFIAQQHTAEHELEQAKALLATAYVTFETSEKAYKERLAQTNISQQSLSEQRDAFQQAQQKLLSNIPSTSRHVETNANTTQSLKLYSVHMSFLISHAHQDTSKPGKTKFKST